MKRREFLTAIGMATVATSLLGKAKIAWAEIKAEFIDMTKKKRKDKLNESAVQVATGLGYVENAVAAEKKGLKRTEKDGKAGTKVKGADQFCDNCNWYKDKEASAIAGKGAPCQMIPTAPPGVLVHAKGYCNSWFAKQA